MPGNATAPDDLFAMRYYKRWRHQWNSKRKTHRALNADRRGRHLAVLRRRDEARENERPDEPHHPRADARGHVPRHPLGCLLPLD